ncbi:methionyl-tRNA formyltransferase, mitochondrial-like [Babylonia areolata]|uniref:methionyl-tRNA formyltransferase, mitochondrial-like n=1 Tax=Babylonia areolata TaxID=304850 RepID=UPI003FD2CB47
MMMPTMMMPTMTMTAMMMKRQLTGVWRGGGGGWHAGCHTSSARPGGDKPPFNILFLGTDSFAVETLRALDGNRRCRSQGKLVDTLHVVSTSTKSAVAEFAHAHDLPLLTWPPRLSDLDLYDLGVLVSFGRMVPRKVIARFPHGVVNVHPSLLPRWRGASPVLHTVLNGDTVTGVSVISILPSHFDRGPIVQQDTHTVPHNTSAQDLAQSLAVHGARLLMSTLTSMPDILTRATPQHDTGVTYAHKLTPSMTWVNWKQHRVQEIRQQYLAIHHMSSLRSQWKEETVKLLDMVLDTDPPFTPSPLPPSPPQHREGGESQIHLEAGAVTFDPQLQAVCVKCADGWVAFRSIVLRKRMAAVDFFNGYLSRDKHPHVHLDSVYNGLFDPHYWRFVSQPKVIRS